MNTTTDSNSTIPAVPLAVVGIGCLFPKAADKSTFWANIKHKVDAITDVPETHWRISDYYDPDPKRPDHTYGKRGGFLDPVDFNPLEFNIQPNILEAIDTSQLLGLIAAREALRDAGYDPAGEFARERVSVLLGVTGALEMVIPLGARLGYPIWRKALLDSGVPADVADDVVERISAAYVPWQENSFPGLLGNVVAGRISKQFNLGGSNSVVDAACGSSLSAVHMAAMELTCGHADMVITGGIDTFNDIFMYTCFSKTPALSPSNRVCPFDESSDGTLIGEGLGLVTLKRLEDAERDNDHIYAVIKSVGSGSDGKGGAIYEPSARGQVRTLRNAQKLAGVEPRDIGLIEAHGTGTKVGDATEIKALREVFGESDGSPWCALGSVKSQIGHAKAAAGAAGLIKTVLALHTKILPPTINVSKPQEVITSGNTPFYVNTEARPWITSADRPRLAGVSAFGFGGSNYHCILEEYRHHKRFCDWDGAPQVLAWSGSTPDELKNNIQKSLAGLRENLSSRKLRAIGAEVRSAYDINAPQRLSCCIEDSHQGATILEQALTLVDSGKEQASTPTGIYYCGKSADISPVEKTAVLFPGQGAQYPYMLRDLACHAPEMLEELERADVALNHECPEPLSTLIYPHSIYTDTDAEKAAQKLQATEHAQPAIGTVSLGAWRYLQRYGVEAGAFAGHSYGELTALCAAGCYTAHDLYSLSRLRGTLMRGDGSDKGTMLAVAAPLEDIEELIKKEDLELVIANKNTPQQGVLSGARAEIERAATACKNAGMRCTPLDVAAAFHSSLVAGAATPFRAELEHVKINTPKAKVYANKSAATYPQDEDGIRTLLAEQLASPVEFVRQIEQMYADGITTFIEVGPGARLSGMVKKILAEKKDVNIITLDASNGKRMGMNDLGRCVAQLAALGIAPNLHVWDEGFASRWLNRPEENSRKPRMSIPICGANYVKEREPLPRSTRTLVDRRELEALKNQQTPQGTGSGHENIGSRTDMNTSDTDTNTPPQGVKTPVSAEILHAQMRMLHKIQEDTARLHEQFLSGQSEALRTMRALMGDVQSTGIEMDSALPKSASERKQQREVTLPREAAPQETTVNQPQPVPSGVPDARAETASGTQRDNPPEADTDIASELLKIVAEKTGYPQEMLELDMSLDADLGIDSIKRVEILSAVQEQLPHLPSVEPQQLSALQTLRQIVDTLEAESGKKKDLNADPSADSSRAPITAPHTGIERQVIRLCAVEAKRGKLDIKAPIWIVDDASPLSEGVAQALESKGYASKVVSPFTTRIPEHLGGLVIPAPVMGADSNFIRDAFALLQRCAPALHAAATEGDAVFFTLSRLDGAFGFDPESLLHDPISGGLAGLSKTAAHEWKDITCRALDIDPLLPEQEQINAVVQELEHAGPQEIGISRCGIFTPVLQNESLPSESPELNLSRADVVIISGGGRGVTAEVALHLAQHSSPTLLLLGRSPLEEEEEWLRSATTEAEIKQTLVKNSPEKLNPRELNAQCQSVLNQRELRRNIERLQQAGSQVLYHALDIRDEEAVKTAVEAARSHGAIRGIIHGAGVLADKRIEDKTLEQFDLVYSTKIGGLQAIIQATAADEVDFIALFSSSTGRFGRTGQIDYAVANEVLNKTAQALARQYPQRRILSLNWGPWDGGMVNTGLKKLFASEGIEVIDLEEGSRYLLQELGGSAKEVELVILGGGTVLQPGNDSGVNECQNVSDQLPNPVMQMPVSCTHLPCLRDHVIDAKAVVPMALSAEWLAQGAMHNFPGLAFFGFDNLRIYRGITLNRDEEQQIELRCDRMEPVAAQRGIYRVAVQVCDAKSATIFSSAEVILADTLPQEIPEPMSGDISAANQENRESIYADSRLFHGPAFQALEQVLGQDERGISALASNAATPAAWVKTPLRHNWLSAPMLLDSSFQLMILWCSASCGCVSLPSSVRCYRQYVEHIPGDVSEIRAHVIRSSDSGAEADIDFIAPDTGKLLARIEGYTCTMTPSLQDAFTRNTLD